jgi:hypothetical protein
VEVPEAGVPRAEWSVYGRFSRKWDKNLPLISVTNVF